MASIYDELTPAWLKNTVLFGVDLTDDAGDPYPEEIYTESIQQAIAWIEHELGIVIDPIVVEAENHDAFEQDRPAFWPFAFDYRPLISVDAMRIKYGNYQAVTLPTSWVKRVSDTHAKIHLIPSSEDLGSYSIAGGTPILLGDVFMPVSYMPGYFEFDYTAGFQTQRGTVTVADGVSSGDVVFPEPMASGKFRLDLTIDGANGAAGVRRTSISKTGFSWELATAPTGGSAVLTWHATMVPADIKRAIGYKASLLPLDIAGDLIGGAGVANYSISLDGLSQNLGTTSSATNSGFGSRVLQFERELKKLLPALRARYRSLNFGSI